MITMSDARASSALVFTSVAPAARISSAGLRLRCTRTVSGNPLLTRFLAMPCPMSPRPMKPTRGLSLDIPVSPFDIGQRANEFAPTKLHYAVGPNSFGPRVDRPLRANEFAPGYPTPHHAAQMNSHRQRLYRAGPALS